MANEVVECSIVHILDEHEEGILVIVGEVIGDDIFALA